MSTLVSENGTPISTDTEVLADTQPEPQPSLPEAPADDVDPKATERKKQAHEVIDGAEVGYLVALMPDGGIAFVEIGEKQQYIQTLGLHEFAKYRIGIMSDTSHGYGPALLVAQTQQLGQMMQVMLKMMTEQSKANLFTKR